MRSPSVAVAAGLLLGIALGAALHRWSDPALLALVLRILALASDIFLRLVQMVIGPLVFATLAGGIARLAGTDRSVGRPVVLAMLWFLIWSVVALTIGTALALWLQPGAGMAAAAASPAPAATLSAMQPVDAFIAHAVPNSTVAAFADNNILQIVVAAMLVGSALAALGDRAPALSRGLAELEALMLTITRRIMIVAPAAAFAAMAGVVGKHGLAVVPSFGGLIADFYLALLVLSSLLLGVLWLLERAALPALLRGLRAPALLALSTSSSEIAFPNLVEALERHGLPRDIVGLVLPLGYSFNLDASMMYCAFGSLFIVQAYGLSLTTPALVGMLAMLLVASKGIAAVPRGALVAIAAVGPRFGVPEAGVALLLGVDFLMNMGRSLVNVLGNAVAAAAVARLERSTTLRISSAATPRR